MNQLDIYPCKKCGEHLGDDGWCYNCAAIEDLRLLPPIPEQFIECKTSMNDLLDARESLIELPRGLTAIQILMLMDYKLWLGELISFWFREMD